MSRIELISISIEGNIVKFNFDFSIELSRYFKSKELLIEYDENLESVPIGVAAIPFICNVLPIIWMTNSTLFVDEIDRDFYSCIDSIKRGYMSIYPEVQFGGSIVINKILDFNNNLDMQKSAMFYSGGLDSVFTLVSHFNENPYLVSIWGSDIKYDNVNGWNQLHNVIEDVSQKYNLPNIIIHSTFREFDNEIVLDNEFSSKLKDGWWHGLKHSLALLGHVAPVAFKKGIKTMYIASSYSPKDSSARCASNPITDNLVRFIGCKVVHDGYNYSRQNKTKNIVDYCRDNSAFFDLHVCWKSQKGTNCCSCEKCYRTMLALIAEGEDPKNYGFIDSKNAIANLKKRLVQFKDLPEIKDFWIEIQKRMVDNIDAVMNTEYWENIKFFIKLDLSNPSKIKYTFADELKCRKGVKNKLRFIKRKII